MARRAVGSTASLAEFELLVLLAVLQHSGDAYPLSIRNAIEERTGRSPSRPAVFITLERLEQKGLLESRYGEATPSRGGRVKRFFTATPAGTAAVRNTLEQVRSMSAGLQSVLKKR